MDREQLLDQLTGRLDYLDASLDFLEAALRAELDRRREVAWQAFLDAHPELQPLTDESDG